MIWFLIILGMTMIFAVRRWSKLIALPRATGVTLSLVITVFSIVGTWSLFIGRAKMMSFSMNWSISESVVNQTESQKVLLKFKDFPNHHLEIYSKQLAEHLMKLNKDEVEVVFKTTWDFGVIRGFHQVQIASLKHWESEGGGSYGVSGSSSKSPWESSP